MLIRYICNLGLALLIAGVGLAVAPVLPLWADDLDAAKKAVKKASVTELLAEFQRRFEARTRSTKSQDDKMSSRGMSSRGLESPLAAFDDATLLKAMRVSVRTIYGTDDREDWYEIKDKAVMPLARASVALLNTADTVASGTKVALNAKTLKETYRLCSGEKFATQPVAAFCSGTLVRPDQILTAGHCVNEISHNAAIDPLPQVSFVFGYRMEAEHFDPTKLSPDQIFAGKELLGGEMSDTKDWALVRLARPVPAEIAEPVTAWDIAPVAKGQKVFVIGYPSGIPLKYAPDAEVRDQSKPGFFVANLDTFGGNSGSGVYDQTSRNLIGVLVRGDSDYVKDTDENCSRVHVCPSTGCRGEDVTRLSDVAAPQ
jgi:hypothetical protein